MAVEREQIDRIERRGGQGSAPPPGARGGLRRALRAVASPDALAVAWLVALAALYLSPAILHGLSFGPFDLGNRLSGLGSGLYTQAHNLAAGDQIEELIPWNTFDWLQIHQLRFPLWNPYSGFGLPQFFNFQSSVLSLPDLVGYLFPLRAAFLVAVAVKLVLAGAGVYCFARVSGLSVPGAALAATVFELCGPFVSEIGWPLADVMAWTGWIFAFTSLLLRSPHARRWVCLLAVSVAFAIYGGFPEADLLLAGAYAVYFAAFLARPARAEASLSGPRRRRWWTALSPARWYGARPPLPSGTALRVGIAWAIGLCLAAPLWLPGLQLLEGSARLILNQRPAIPLRGLSTWLLHGYYGYPLHGNTYFGPFSYYETVGYVGVPALVLAAVAVLRRLRERVVFAAAVAALVLAAIGYDTGLFGLASQALPSLSAVLPGRLRIPIAFGISVLAGFGFDTLLHGWHDPATRGAYRLGLAAVAAAVLALLAHAWRTRAAFPAGEAATRLQSFVWPLGLLAGMALLDGWTAWQRRSRHRDRARRLACACLLAAEAAFLLSAGIGLNTYSRTFLPRSAALTRLQGIVGNSLVGFGADGGNAARYGGLGLIPEMNVAYGLHELAIYDPMIPAAYAAAWAGLTGTSPVPAGWFVPAVRSAAIARTLGVAYVLAPAAGPAPQGMTFVTDVGDERLYRAPGASRFSLVPAAAGDAILSARPTGAASWTIQVQTAEPTTLIARLTDVPGWHATGDGRPLVLRSWLGVLQQVRLPPGRHTIRLWYWPPLFTLGLWLALTGLLGMVAVGAGTVRPRSGTSRPST